MKRAVVEVVASRAVGTSADVERFVRCTLLAATTSFEAVKSSTLAALEWLEDPYTTPADKATRRALLAEGQPLPRHLQQHREGFIT
jgi:DNA polymerase theta